MYGFGQAPTSAVASDVSSLNFLIQGMVATGVAPLAGATVQIMGPNDTVMKGESDDSGYVRFAVPFPQGTTIRYDVYAPKGYVSTNGESMSSDASAAIQETVTLEQAPAAKAAPSTTPAVVLGIVLLLIIGGNYLLKRY